MNYSVYITNPFLDPIIPLLQPAWHVVSPADLQKEKASICALATSVWENIDADYLSQFPGLKVICHLGIGTYNIDCDYLKNHGITLFSQPTAGVHDTAELALTLMLSLSRRIVANDWYARTNHWVEKKPKLVGNHLLGKRLGLVGLGQIGSTVAHFAQAFGMEIAYNTRTKKETPYTYYNDIETLAAQSDFLILCCSGGPGTYHLINKKVLAQLGPQGYLINVCRGSVVDEIALIEALTKGTIAGAALDVYADEPAIPIALRELDNVLLSPHMGSSTKENLQIMFNTQAQQLNEAINKGLL